MFNNGLKLLKTYTISYQFFNDFNFFIIEQLFNVIVVIHIYFYFVKSTFKY